MIHEAVITGTGVTTAVGQNNENFLAALLEGRQRFGLMQRNGRLPEGADGDRYPFIGAEIPEIDFPPSISRRTQRAASFAAQVAMVTLDEAWRDADLDGLDSDKIGLVVGGSNLQQRESVVAHNLYRARPDFIRPSYALQHMDTDICGFCAELFNIRGGAVTVGAASASGQMALIQAANSVALGLVDVCIALGSMADISYWESIAFKAAGAMGGDGFIDHPELACRPFDRDHNGFIYGESCGAIVVESLQSAKRRARKPYTKISGYGIVSDGNRSSNPSYDGESKAIAKALAMAGLSSKDIDYISPHGTGAKLGDATEANVLVNAGLGHARINTTKSITGHGLSAAGSVELVATLLQMRVSKLHPSLNLDNPICSELNWVVGNSVEHEIDHALSLSMGFGGINTAVCLSKFF